MIKNFFKLYSPSLPRTLVYMLQVSEYGIRGYLRWIWRTDDFGAVAHRKQLDPTKYARVLLLALQVGILLQIVLGLSLILSGIDSSFKGGISLGVTVLVAYPFVWAHLVVVPLLLGKLFIANPRAKRQIKAAESIFTEHKGIKIAVLGSYGKTTMKELLAQILGVGLKVSATPANKNVSVSHAAFARSLKGDEEVLIIEYGEGEPGDIVKFAKNTRPDYAIITGLAPAHLDKYPDMHSAAHDIFSIADFVERSKIFVNLDSELCREHMVEPMQGFDARKSLGWSITNIKTDLKGSSFELKKASKKIKFTSRMIGEHQIAFVAFAATLALKLDVNQAKVVKAVEQTKPFEHRMQPYQLNGAWVIDDTYNGNLEGIRAGTALLKKLKAKRKIYVTPGLVDQGIETEAVHIEMGKLIAGAGPDQVVLMKNSVTDLIKIGLDDAGFNKLLTMVDDPLNFYQNLAHFVADGDLVVMQNDWPDNYA